MILKVKKNGEDRRMQVVFLAKMDIYFRNIYENWQTIWQHHILFHLFHCNKLYLWQGDLFVYISIAFSK